MRSLNTKRDTLRLSMLQVVLTNHVQDYRAGMLAHIILIFSTEIFRCSFLYVHHSHQRLICFLKISQGHDQCCGSRSSLILIDWIRIQEGKTDLQK
jgi:hypothetical protein